MAYRASMIKSIQYGSITLNGAVLSNTAAINAVTLTNSFVVSLGSKADDGYSLSETQAAFTLTSATQVTATRGTNSGPNVVAQFMVVEFYAGVVRSIQRSSATIASGTNTIASAITAVTVAKTMLFPAGWIGPGATTSGSFVNFTLTNTTTVTAVRGNSAANVAVVHFAVVEFR